MPYITFKCIFVASYWLKCDESLCIPDVFISSCLSSHLCLEPSKAWETLFRNCGWINVASKMLFLMLMQHMRMYCVDELLSTDWC